MHLYAMIQAKFLRTLDMFQTFITILKWNIAFAVVAPDCLTWMTKERPNDYSVMLLTFVLGGEISLELLLVDILDRKEAF